MLFFALAAAGMLTACSNEDTLSGGEKNVSDQQIKLGVSSSVVTTRGTGTVGGLTTEDNVWAGQTLWVYMLQKGSMDLAYYQTPDEVNGGVAGTAVFDNKEFTAPVQTMNQETGNLEGVASGVASTADGQIAYYPVSNNFDFWGYRVDDAAIMTQNAAGENVPNVETVDDEGNVVEAAQATKRVASLAIDGSQDIMAGKAVPSTEEVNKLGNYQENFYSAYAARHDVQPNITFNHLLTRFTFEVRAGSKSAAGAVTGGHTEAVRVKSIAVDSKTQGKLTVAYTGAEKTSTDLLTFDGDATSLYLKQRDVNSTSHNDDLVALEEVPLTWPLDENGEAKDVDENGQPITTGDVIAVGEALLVAPGETSYPLTVDLAQKVKQNVNDQAQNLDLQQKTNIKMDGVKVFEPGKSYKVTITVYGLEEIVVTATLVPWTDGGSIDIDDDRDPNNPTYTEPAQGQN